MQAGWYLAQLSEKVKNCTREDLYVILRSGKEEYKDRVSSAMTAFLELHELSLPEDWRSQPLFLALYLVLPNDVRGETFEVRRIMKGERIGCIDYEESEDEEYECCDYDGRSHMNEWYEYPRVYTEYIIKSTTSYIPITARPVPIPGNFIELVTKFAETFPCTLNLKNLKKFLPSEGPYSIPEN